MFKDRKTEIRLVLIFGAIMGCLQLFTRDHPPAQVASYPIQEEMPSPTTTETLQNAVSTKPKLKDILENHQEEPTIVGGSSDLAVMVEGVVIKMEETALIYMGGLDFLQHQDLRSFFAEYPEEKKYTAAVSFLTEKPSWEVGQEVSFDGELAGVLFTEQGFVHVRYIHE